MTNKICCLIVSLLILIPSAVFAIPGAHDPVTGGYGLTCNSCHISGKTIGNRDTTYATNTCSTCHTAGNPQTKKQFNTNDFSNPFATVNTAIVSQSSPVRSSHKWFGPDTVPAAGAQAPVDTTAKGLNMYGSQGYGGYLSCGRCHSVHGTSGTSSLTAPFLRAANDSDQMCRNCHAPRDTKDHTFGTHPVNVSYSSAYKASPTTFLSTPVKNTVNPTGQVKLISGIVQCSTCHGVHNADSRTSTFDSFTTAHLYNNLSTSKGYLLRVDARGKAANDVNICTNCHTAKLAHNANAQNIQCNDCHGGHVEYDASAPAELKNVFLVRRFNTYSASTGGFNKNRVLFRYTSAARREYYNYPAKTGVCQNCHNLTSGHFVLGVEANGLSRVVCSDCHKHNDVGGSFKAAGCDVCHGYPPTTNTLGGKTGYAAGYGPAFDESTTPHGSHAAGGGSNYQYTCDQCHKGNTHQNSVFTDVFKSPVGTIAGGTATYLSPNCSNVYCHSNGAGAYKAGQNPVAWGSLKKGTIIGQATECTTCHENTAIVTGSHARHVGSFAYGCVACHAATVSANTTLLPASRLAGGTHVNGIKDVQFSGVLPAVGATCSTVACHSDGKGSAPVITPVWGTASSGACNACHRTTSSAPKLATGSHTLHFSVVSSSLGVITSADPAIVCAKCHIYTAEVSATHVNGTLNVTTGCSVCHGATPPTWGINTTNDTCTKCHGTPTAKSVITAAAGNRYLVAPPKSLAGLTGTLTGTGLVSNNVKVGAHQTHLQLFDGFNNYSTVDYRCQGCHGPIPTSGTHANGSSSPIWSTTNISTKWGGRTPTFNAASLTCSNTYCHNPAGTGGTLNAANVGFAVQPSWTSASYIAAGTLKTQTNCNRCHKVPGDTGFTSTFNHGALTAVSDCSACHNHNGNTTGTAGKRHMDGIKYGGGDCNSCHDYDTVGSTYASSKWSGGTWGKAGTNFGAYPLVAEGWGAHAKHINYIKTRLLIAVALDPTNQTFGLGNPANVCGSCHTNLIANHNMGGSTGDPTGRVINFGDSTFKVGGTTGTLFLFGASNPLYNGVSGTSSGTTGKTCSNLSCHYFTTPVWSTY